MPEGLIPDGATNRVLVGSCAGSVCTLAATSSGGGGIDCTDVGCNFGPPLPIPNGGLSTCVVNTFAGSGSGSIDKSTGDLTLSVPLSSHVFITGQPTQPCPRCSATGSPASLGSGTCDRGARMGLSCTTTNSQGLSSDCLPGGSDSSADLGTIGVDLTPLVSTTASKSDAGGILCPSQAQAGCFGQSACRTVSVDGLPAGPISPDTPLPVTLASVFLHSLHG